MCNLFFNGIFAGILFAKQKTGTVQSQSAKCLLSLLFQNKSFSWWQWVIQKHAGSKDFAKEREMCSAVPWLLCEILFNDIATEEVLYYLSHCSSLQPQHCISTLLFYIYKQPAIPEKFLFQLQNSTDPSCVITSPCWGKSCFCSCRRLLPTALGGTRCPSWERAPMAGMASVLCCTQPSGQEAGVVLSHQNQDHGCSSRAAATLHHLQKPHREEELCAMGTWLVLTSQRVQRELGPFKLALQMQWGNSHALPQHCCTGQILPKAIWLSLIFISFPAKFFLRLEGELRDSFFCWII